MLFKFFKQSFSPSWLILLALIITSLGLYLRFHNIAGSFGYGWDQGRDAWKVRDLLYGQLPLEGPRTGIGHFHLGPLYYYLLAPFYFFADFDPAASQYFNFVINVLTFAVVYYVFSRIFHPRIGLFAIMLYAFNHYLIKQNIIPWNVSLLPAVSFLIFYSIYQLYQSRWRYIYLLAFLCGLFFHIHLTAIFILPIVCVSLLPLFLHRKFFRTAILASPIFFIFLAPTILFNLNTNGGEQLRIHKFIQEYTHPFYFRFLLYRSQEALHLLRELLFFNPLKPFALALLILTYIWTFFSRQLSHFKLLAALTIPWFLLPLLGFTLYRGPTSDYYYLLTIPAVLTIIILGTILLLRTHRFVVIPLALFFLFYAYSNTNMYWQKPSEQGLNKQKATVQEKIQLGESIPYQEGSIDAYLYQIAIERQPLPNILIVNLIRGPQLGLEGRDLVASLEGQIRATKQKGVRATWLWSFSALQNPQLVELAKSKLADDEHGLFFEIDPDSAAASGVAYRGRSSWYHSDGLFLTSYDVWERTKIIDTYFQKFNSQFNYNPTSVGAWWIGAQPIAYLQQKYGVTAVLQCADQFATDAYSLWGTPWSIAYQPSRHNAAIPAQDYFDRSKVTIVQWAPRDPLRGYGNSVENSTYSAQDFTYKNYSLDYFTKLKDTYAQKPHDAFVFGLESGFDPEVYQIGLAHQVALANSWRNDTQVNLTTMKNFAAQFRRADRTLADTSTGLFDEYQGPNQSWWYHSPHYRLLVQKIGEQVSIVDLRNYHARIQEEWFNFPNTQSLLRIHAPSIIDSVRHPHHLWQVTQTRERLRVENTNGQYTLFAGAQKLLTATSKKLIVHTLTRPPVPQYFLESQTNTWTYLPTPEADFNFLPLRLHFAQASQSIFHDINNFLDWFSFRKLHQFYILIALAFISLAIYFLRRHKRPLLFTLVVSLIYAPGTYLVRTYPIQLTPSEKIALTSIPEEINVAVLVNSQYQGHFKGPQPLLTQDHALISRLIDRPVQKITFLHYSDLEKQDLPEIILAPRFLMADPPEDLMQQINYQKSLDLGTIAIYQKI